MQRVDGKLEAVEAVRGRTALVRQGVRQVQKRERQVEEARAEAERAELLKAAEAATAKVTWLCLSFCDIGVLMGCTGPGQAL